VVIDATNPIAAKPPQNGVLSFYTSGDDSQLERLQREFPQARLVKAFNSVGSADMVDPQFAGGKPSMFICGADANAKATVRGILDQFGWETEDMGDVEAGAGDRAARHPVVHPRLPARRLAPRLQTPPLSQQRIEGQVTHSNE
jgi:predicted dinucleotide-binding enzyme